MLENVESIKYLGVTITKDLKWNTHIKNLCNKAKFLRQNPFSCHQDVREAAYKGLVGQTPTSFHDSLTIRNQESRIKIPILEYGCSVWGPYLI